MTTAEIEAPPAPERNAIYLGDAYARMRKWPDTFIDCTVTSVPYWQQRDYLPDGHQLKPFEMGNESTPEKYIDDLGVVFGELHRLTKPTGVCWVNIGDKRAGRWKRKLKTDFREGELMGLPWKFAEEMRRRGWLRVAEIIWFKPNANPESTRRRPIDAHEQVFLFARGQHHYFDVHAIEEPAKYPGKRMGKMVKHSVAQGTVAWDTGDPVGLMRRSRSVWAIPTVGLDGREVLADFAEEGRYLFRDPNCEVHGDAPIVSAGPLFDGCAPEDCACTCEAVTQDFFAAMPPALAERCILGSTPDVGCCVACGAPLARMTKKQRIPTRTGRRASFDYSGRARRDSQRHVTVTETIGWEMTCGCPVARPTPALIFDPFTGSGTTPMVAAALGRDYLGCELSPDNAKLARARVAAGWQRS